MSDGAEGKGWRAALRRSQVYRSIVRHDHDGSDRDRVLRIASNVFLHLHPTKIPRHALRLTFTWGLGGVSFLLFLVLVCSGMVLMFHYRPTPEHAHADVAALSAGAGRVLRNLHRGGADAMVVAVVLHLLRVFLTGSYKPPRELNWVVGVVLLVLTLALAFTGHLLPWDVASTGAIAAAGVRVDGGTLLRCYASHCVALPLVAVVLMSVHFWRVRKDGISGPP